MIYKLQPLITKSLDLLPIVHLSKCTQEPLSYIIIFLWRYSSLLRHMPLGIYCICCHMMRQIHITPPLLNDRLDLFFIKVQIDLLTMNNFIYPNMLSKVSYFSPKQGISMSTYLITATTRIMMGIIYLQKIITLIN